MGAMMGPRMMRNRPDGYAWLPHMKMMGLAVSPAEVLAGAVSLRVHNSGALTHEVLILPLAPGQSSGQRVINVDGQVDESGNVGEASRTCGAGEGDGIQPAAAAWTTVNLPPGRYEVLCNVAGHYGTGMYAELDVTPGR
jgi:uncharacterized cupredoxin-like copper-binding protein